MRQVPDVPAMACVLDAWAMESARMVPPLGRWAVENRDQQVIVGGAALLPLPPGGEDVEIAWQVSPAHQRRGYATEAARTLLSWAFTQSLPEVLAVSRPGNIAARGVIDRLGMEWVGETDKYYGLTLAVHRLRPSDFKT
jgi:RimJ/RimL family protein N-acetyltransferase